jgi:hypothetical protein
VWDNNDAIRERRYQVRFGVSVRVGIFGEHRCKLLSITRQVGFSAMLRFCGNCFIRAGGRCEAEVSKTEPQCTVRKMSSSDWMRHTQEGGLEVSTVIDGLSLLRTSEEARALEYDVARFQAVVTTVDVSMSGRV